MDEDKETKQPLYIVKPTNPLVSGVVATLVIMGASFGFAYLTRDTTPESIHQEQVIGKVAPETYVELNGVKYYSHIDGKSVEDLVKRQNPKSE